MPVISIREAIVAGHALKNNIEVRFIVVTIINSGVYGGDYLTYQSHCQTGRGLVHTGQNPTWTQRARSNPRKRSSALVQSSAKKDKSTISYLPHLHF